MRQKGCIQSFTIYYDTFSNIDNLLHCPFWLSENKIRLIPTSNLSVNYPTHKFGILKYLFCSIKFPFFTFCILINFIPGWFSIGLKLSNSSVISLRNNSGTNYDLNFHLRPQKVLHLKPLQNGKSKQRVIISLTHEKYVIQIRLFLKLMRRVCFKTQSPFMTSN